MANEVVLCHIDVVNARGNDDGHQVTSPDEDWLRDRAWWTSQWDPRTTVDDMDALFLVVYRKSEFLYSRIPYCSY